MHTIMDLNYILKIINRQSIKSRNRPLNSTETIMLQGIWQYKTYTQMAIEAGYSPGYFTTVVAPELYQKLSELIGQRVCKKNCRRLLESYVSESATTETRTSVDTELKQNLPSYPSGAVPLTSSFYLKRACQEQIEREIRKPGALIRIKAPREMGKTSLLLRNLNYAESLGYHTVSLNLEQVEDAILSNLNLFLRWLSATISRQLQLKPKLDEYWEEDLGSTISCTLYLQDYLLDSLDNPLVLALDEVNEIFEHPRVAKDFLPLLRSWYEEGKRLPIWQKLRLLVVHSTEIYVPLKLNQSPFNVGLPIRLDSFSLAEVRQLARRYGLNWQDGREAELMAMVGGHPALIHLALYHLSQGEITLSQLLETAPTASGIYDRHLQRHWTTLEQQPELAQALAQILNANKPIALNPIAIYKLSSMGLIEQTENKAIASCELYRQYFTKSESAPSF